MARAGPGFFLDAAAIQDDGAVVASSSNYWDMFNTEIHVVRFKPEGGRDRAFGKASFDPGSTTTMYAMANQRSGIVVSANGYTVRLDGEGTLDETFGVKHLSHWVAPVELVIQADQRIVVFGSVSSGFAVGRLTEDGAPDLEFGGDGLAATRFPGAPYVLAGVIDAHGRLIAAGTSGHRFVRDFALARYWA
jgi:hypothetical protein